MKINIFQDKDIVKIISDVEKNKICPCCNHKLYEKWEGWTCKNFKCVLYSKLGKGWFFTNKDKQKSSLFFTSKYDFDINSYRNRKEWLQLKSKVLYEKKRCEICQSDKRLHVHHILPRSSNPELALDYENLMVLCRKCHKKIHENDKWRFE